jgi:hypothetical protein
MRWGQGGARGSPTPRRCACILPPDAVYFIAIYAVYPVLSPNVNNAPKAAFNVLRAM